MKTKDIDDLTPNQGLLYNSIITEFYASIFYTSKHMRLGQGFYNFGYEKGIFRGSFPELFYCEDNTRAKDTIIVCLCEYVKEQA